MAVITGGNIIKGGVTTEGTIARNHASNGVPATPIAGTVLAHLVAGDLVTNTATGFVYEYTTGPEAFTRIDTV